MPGFWGNIAKNRLCDLQVIPGARIAWLRVGGINKFWGGTKRLILRIRECGPKKRFSSRNMRGLSRIPGWSSQKKDLYFKIWKKTVLAHEFLGDNQYLWSPRPRTALQWHWTCYFLWSTIFAWGAQFLFGVHKQWFGGEHGPGMPPVVSGLLQVYSNLSNCNYRIFG